VAGIGGIATGSSRVDHCYSRRLTPSSRATSGGDTILASAFRFNPPAQSNSAVTAARLPAFEPPSGIAGGHAAADGGSGQPSSRGEYRFAKLDRQPAGAATNTVRFGRSIGFPAGSFNRRVWQRIVVGNFCLTPTPINCPRRSHGQRGVLKWARSRRRCFSLASAGRPGVWSKRLVHR
jgi:hypothetical protein